MPSRAISVFRVTKTRGGGGTVTPYFGYSIINLVINYPVTAFQLVNNNILINKTLKNFILSCAIFSRNLTI